jgi:hypothetical protein
MDVLWREMGSVRPPEKITQEAYDRDDGHLRRLARLHPGQRAEASDLWDYAQDLRYTEIQGPLLAYCLPFCLEAWREDVRGTDGYGGFVENFYPVLADCRIFELYLTPRQNAAVSEFMRRVILDEIDPQCGLSFKGANARPYRWIRALTTHGVLFPDLQRLWNAWWSLDTAGRAISAVQYISCLMYSEYENPVFAPWTGERGGGPPCLWEFEGHLYAHRWLQPNVDFLKESLSVYTVSDLLVRAVNRLAGHTEFDTAAAIRDDFPLCKETVETRCAELPKFLETVQHSTTDFRWSV